MPIFSLLGETMFSVIWVMGWMDCLVMFRWMMLACIISTIVYAAMPQVKEFALCIAAFEPVEALIH